MENEEQAQLPEEVVQEAPKKHKKSKEAEVAEVVSTANPDERYHHEAYVAKMQRKEAAVTGISL